MYEVIALPLMAAMGGTGRELTYLGGLLKTIQEYTLEAMESEKVAYSMERWVNRNLSKKTILIAQEDISETVTEKDLAKCLNDRLQVVATSVADKAFLDAAGNTLTSYVVAPVFPGKGSFCYKMLFEADTHSLVYISKHKIEAKKGGVGFLTEDLKKLSK